MEVKDCQALVLAPTRELAQQIVKVIAALGDFMNIKIHACVGGTAVRDDIRTLQVTSPPLLALLFSPPFLRSLLLTNQLSPPSPPFVANTQDGVHVVVGTPGRVYDMIQRRALKLDHVQLFVLDEADEMLSRCVSLA